MILFTFVLPFGLLQLLCLNFYPFLSSCWAVLYIRRLTSSVYLKTCFAFVSMRPLPREGGGSSAIAATQKLGPTLGLEHLGQGRASVPTPTERPVFRRRIVPGVS